VYKNFSLTVYVTTAGTTLKFVSRFRPNMEDPYECNACGEAFESREALLQHTYDIGLMN
jgi:hypothetical protein